MRPICSQSPVTAVRFCNDEFVLVGAGRYLKLYSWHSSTLGRSRMLFPVDNIHGISLNGHVAVVWGGRSIAVLDNYLGSFDARRFTCGDRVIAARLFCSVIYLLTAHNEVVRVDFATLAELGTQRCALRSMLYSGELFFDSEVQFAAAGTIGGKLVVWDIFTGEVRLDLQVHKGSVFCVAFSESGRRIATCSDDRTITVSSLIEKRIVSQGWGHTSRVWRVQFVNGDYQLLSCSEDCTVRLWTSKEKEMQCLRILRGHHGRNVWAVDFFDGVVCSGGGDGKIMVWDLFLPSRTDKLDVKTAFGGSVRSCCVGAKGQLAVTTTTGKFFVNFGDGWGEITPPLNSVGVVKRAGSGFAVIAQNGTGFYVDCQTRSVKYVFNCKLGMPVRDFFPLDSRRYIVVPQQKSNVDGCYFIKIYDELLERADEEMLANMKIVSDDEESDSGRLQQPTNEDLAIGGEMMSIAKLTEEDLEETGNLKRDLEVELSIAKLTERLEVTKYAGTPQQEVHVKPEGLEGLEGSSKRKCLLPEAEQQLGKTAEHVQKGGLEQQHQQQRALALKQDLEYFLNAHKVEISESQLEENRKNGLSACYELNWPNNSGPVTAAGLCSSVSFCVGTRRGDLLMYFEGIPRPYVARPRVLSDKSDAITQIELATGAVLPHLVVSSRSAEYGKFEIPSLKRLLKTRARRRGCIEGFSITPQGFFTYGFVKDLFIVENTDTGTECVKVDCGGAHRSWSAQVVASTLTLAYVRGAELILHVSALASDCFASPVVQHGTHGREIRAIEVRPGSSVLFATCSEDSTVQFSWLRDHGLEQGTHLVPEVRIPDGHVSGIQCMHWMPGGRYLFTGAGQGELVKWEVRTPRSFGPIYVNEAGRCPNLGPLKELRIMEFDFLSQLIAVAYSDGSFRVWDTRDWKLLAEHRNLDNFCLMNIHQLYVDHQLATLVSGSDGHLSVFFLTLRKGDFRLLDATLKHRVKLHQSSVRSSCLVHMLDGTKLYITGGDDNAIVGTTVKISAEGVETTERFRIPNAHSAAVTALKFVPGRRRNFVSIGSDQKVKLWTLEGKLLQTAISGVSDAGAVAVTPYRLLVAGLGVEMFSL